MDELSISVEPLGSQHDCVTFSCGEPALDDYLRHRASQDVRRRVAQVFVAAGDTPGKIAGYYTLSAVSFEKDRLPDELAKKLPHYPVPAALIGRFAIGCTYQGIGLGEFLLLDAIRRIVHASLTIAVYAIVVDAKNDNVQTFYERYGFKSFASQPRRLFMPVQTFVNLGL